jgi:hypothetical protein
MVLLVYLFKKYKNSRNLGFIQKIGSRTNFEFWCICLL